MAILPGLDWAARYGSLCDCPVEPIVETWVETDHPARLFQVVWAALPRDPLPRRSDLDPHAFPSLLKWCMILEREGETPAGSGLPDFRIRLHGTAVAQMTHRDLTGFLLSEYCRGAALRSRQRAMLHAIRDAEPVFVRAAVTGCERARVEVMIGFFPFAGTDPGREQIVAVGAPSDRALRQLL
ncbi:MAG: hypothetical protein KatS3mg119_2150 [Rhodothalassiaceae bacterium]|nr:MAG: hypothetical protein KatS3mg119_2150 [Rhodothalassiaceae bacterium]